VADVTQTDRAEAAADPLIELGRAPVPPPPAHRRLQDIGWSIARLGPILALALAWELAARSGAFTPFMLPTLSSVLERIWDDLVGGELLLNTGVTLYRAMVGFLIGGVAGIVLGMAISRNAVANWFFDPIISVGFPMPKIAFLPVVILWLGVYDMSKITMVSVEAIFPVVTATIIGIRGVEREILWSARNMGASELELLWQIAFPAALPQIITGLQVALPIALIVAIVTEMFMGGYGLGGAMNTASRFADSRGVFAGIVEIAVIGYALVKLMAIVRRRLLLWHQEALAPSTV
jgi:ABC-type nitrate/sulfonate/bicarbonate transport system permease component